MKTRLFIAACLAGLLTACSQKQSAITMPSSKIDLEKVRDGIDYNMDVSDLSISDLRLLRNAPAARQGFPFKDSYIRGMYLTTTWYDSLTLVFDEKLEDHPIQAKEHEGWRDAYYRTSEELHLLKYTPEEEAFMKRLKDREDELLKQNFNAGEGLRVNVQNLINPRQLKDFDPQISQQLAKDGFGIVASSYPQLFNVYEENDYSDFPNFVTTDLYLQLFHLYFDCMLRELEEHTLLKLMTDFSSDMVNTTHQLYTNSDLSEEDKQLALHNAAFFTIAYQLFTGEYNGNDEEQSLAKPEIERVMKATNATTPFFMDYRKVEFPYSLFRPRGHYTRSEALQRYFRGMMWLQTAPYGLDNREELKEAVMMALALKQSDDARQKYDKLNRLITLLMGKPDNLSILQVIDEVNKTGKGLELLSDQLALDKVGKNLAETAKKQTRIAPKHEKTSHTKVCIMPQRYQPDAEVLLEMVDYDSQTTKRATPKGLDVFAALGVTAAEQILLAEKQEWSAYKPTLDKMKKRMNEIDWQETIATQWVNSLKTIAGADKDKRCPYFMGTPEWDLKNLNAILASWAELKHDAILYAKQPMGAECGGGGIPDPVVRGYVEPNVPFWQKSIALLDHIQQVMEQEQMLTEKVKESTIRIREEAEFLLHASEKELSGKMLTDEEYDHIEYIGAQFENISLDMVREPDQSLMGWSDVQGADKNVAVVADVYTANADNNPDKTILYEAVGNADVIYVIVEINGYLYLTRGGVLSYREFTEPIDQQRLTDEEWQKQLEKDPRKGVPTWMQRITIPLEQQPKPDEETFYSSGC